MKPVVYSAIQPSSETLTIGNYLGALLHWVRMQEDNECIYCIADMHAFSSIKTNKAIRSSSLDILALYLACGIDPINTIAFIQSHVLEHSQLNWLLSCYVYFGELKRMTQFKEKHLKAKEPINIGIFSYPVLMAADILLYQTAITPIGKDQKQHIELTKAIANRFNNMYGEAFTIPQPCIAVQGACIMSLLQPNIKMSKSDIYKRSTIYLLDSLYTLGSKVNKTITDSDMPPTIYYEPIFKPGISNLLTLLSCVDNPNIALLEIRFELNLYGCLKKAVIHTLNKLLTSLHTKCLSIRKDESYLNKLIYDGSIRASIKAKTTMNKLYIVLGMNS
ncbi:tryptophan--tRNA ligase [Candidatus Tremblaya phenacola]|uniref:Tryptophan--tRNA ligase n=1 Tax=Candidatus Tremblayella phenacoccinincola TaxID=1010676 RepID=A0A2G0V799_9PROT|nr:tryptophan--tRNA ligase [Candidatus Tremblaya phenacola]PHN16338.1 Tryptophan--tRNA ligase [Candidatus Tremblaya phenacola]